MEPPILWPENTPTCRSRLNEWELRNIRFGDLRRLHRACVPGGCNGFCALLLVSWMYHHPHRYWPKRDTNLARARAKLPQLKYVCSSLQLKIVRIVEKPKQDVSLGWYTCSVHFIQKDSVVSVQWRVARIPSVDMHTPNGKHQSEWKKMGATATGTKSIHHFRWQHEYKYLLYFASQRMLASFWTFWHNCTVSNRIFPHVTWLELYVFFFRNLMYSLRTINLNQIHKKTEEQNKLCNKLSCQISLWTNSNTLAEYVISKLLQLELRFSQKHFQKHIFKCVNRWMPCICFTSNALEWMIAAERVSEWMYSRQQPSSINPFRCRKSLQEVTVCRSFATPCFHYVFENCPIDFISVRLLDGTIVPYPIWQHRLAATTMITTLKCFLRWLLDGSRFYNCCRLSTFAFYCCTSIAFFSFTFDCCFFRLFGYLLHLVNTLWEVWLFCNWFRLLFCLFAFHRWHRSRVSHHCSCKFRSFFSVGFLSLLSHGVCFVQMWACF